RIPLDLGPGACRARPEHRHRDGANGQRRPARQGHQGAGPARPAGRGNLPDHAGQSRLGPAGLRNAADQGSRLPDRAHRDRQRRRDLPRGALGPAAQRLLRQCRRRRQAAAHRPVCRPGRPGLPDRQGHGREAQHHQYRPAARSGHRQA
ncbi:hypothetical protein LTR94_033583, partial [Friedmanniomyces endolithicus]